MKKISFLAVVLLFSLTLLTAQAISDYSFSTSTDGSLQDMTGSTNLLTPGIYYDDTASAVTNIGFPFLYGLGIYTQFSANSNGQLRLGPTAISGSATSPAANTPLLAPLSGDNCIRATGKLHYLVVGSAPNRILVVEWLDLRVPYSSSTETGTYCRMQAWLYESSNNIKFVYGTMYNMATSAQSRGIFISTSNVAGSVGNIETIITTPTWTTNGTSVVTTSFPASSAMTNLNSSADGSRRVFNFNFPTYTSAPNAAVLVSPTNGSWAFTTATLNWTSGGGGATSYDVYLGTNPSPSFVTNVVANTYAPTLAAGTTYYWRIDARNANGATTGTVWSFQTPTATQLAESFENTTFPPAGWTNPGSWSRYTYYYQNGTASAYRYGSSSTQYILSTPKCTITATSALNLWTLCSSTTGTLQIVYSPDRTTWTQIGSNITHAATYTWYNSNIDLSSLAGNNYYLGIRTGLQSASFYIDMVIGPEITPEAPGAPVLSTPADLATLVNEFTSFSWTAPTTGGVPTGYRLYCDTNNPPTTLKVDQTGLSYTLTTPLAYNTTYYWTVKAYNAAGEGPLATVRSFTTRPDPIIYTFPWVIDFGTTGTPWPPTNWSMLSGLYGSETPTSTTSGWYYDDFCNVVTSPQNMSARLNIWSTSTKYWLVTPPIAIPASGYELKFDLGLTTYNGINVPPTAGAQADDKFIVLIDSSPMMTSPTILRRWDNTGSPYVYDNISAFGENHIINLSSYTGTKYIAFYGESTVSGGDNYIYVDNVTVRETPAAPIFSYTPTSINFGTVMNGVQTGPQNVTITNTGGGTLTINASDISIIGTNAAEFSFSAANLPASLAGGQSVVIPVYVTGTTEGAISATLRITNAYRTDHDVALSATVLPVGISIIGNGTTDLSLPIEPWYGYTYSQSIFLQSEIGVTEAKMIDKIYYHWNGAGEATNSNNWTVYMGHTSLTSFATGTSWIPLSSLTQVFTGEVALPAVDGWIEIPLDTPFLYNGTDNLAICVDENEPGYDSSSDYFYCTSTTAYRSIYYYADYTNPDPAAPPAGTTVMGYPNLMLLTSTPPAFVNLTYPADGAINVPLTPAGFDFTWNAWLPGGPITGYDFYIATSEETITDDPVYAEYGLTGTSHNAIANGWTPSYNTRYFWMVTANNAETSMNSAVYSFTFQADPRITIPYTQDFGTTLTWPLNWTQSYTTGGSNRWTVANSNYAGGTSNEMRGSWTSGIFISRLITPPINTQGITTFVAKFKHYFNDYAAGITYKMQYSYDLNTWYDSPWTNASGTGDASGTVNVIFTGINQPITYVAWVLDGNHYQFDFWYVDDVQLMVPLNNDVGVASWDLTQQVFPEGAVVTPKATVTNYGLNTQSFTVTCTIGSYSNTQSVSNLAFGATQQVTFANYLPSLWTAELATVTTNLASDQDADNNTVENVVICLPLNTPALANNAQTDQYVQFNLDNPGTLHVLPNGYTGSYFMSGGSWVNGTWKTVEYDDGTLTTDNFYDINPLSGASTLIGPTGAALMGIAFDDNDGTGDTLYGVSSDGYLYTVDITTGAATVIDSLWYDLGAQGQWSLANIGGLMIDIAYDNANNILYGVDLGNDCLWTINPATCELTFIGYFGIDLNYAQGASFDEVNGLMFLAGYSNGGALYWVDTTYGGAYKVGSFGTSAYELDAFAIPYGTAPETPVVTAATSGRVLSWPNVQGAAQYKIYASDDPYGNFTYYATAYTNSWTDPDITSAKKFYKVTAVGGRMASNRHPIRYTNELRKTKVSSPKPASFGIANR